VLCSAVITLSLIMNLPRFISTLVYPQPTKAHSIPRIWFMLLADCPYARIWGDLFLETY